MKKFMATIVHPVAAFTSGLNVFKRDALEDNERSGRPRNVVNEENAEIVLEFIRREPKSTLKCMESELGISTASIYRILTENLVYIKVCVKFVAHTLKPHKKISEFNI